MTSKRSISDEMAINWICDLLTENNFTYETLQKILQVVEFTGRQIPTRDIEGQ